MAARKSYKSDALAAIHETAVDLVEVDAITRQTMRDFDQLCLTPVADLSPAEIREIREREEVSQPVFAAYLNVSKGLVSQWERGEKHPSGASLKLLNLVRNKGLQAIS